MYRIAFSLCGGYICKGAAGTCVHVCTRVEAGGHSSVIHSSGAPTFLFKDKTSYWHGTSQVGQLIVLFYGAWIRVLRTAKPHITKWGAFPAYSTQHYGSCCFQCWFHDSWFGSDIVFVHHHLSKLQLRERTRTKALCLWSVPSALAWCSLSLITKDPASWSG